MRRDEAAHLRGDEAARMRTDEVAVALRQRSGLEALDLGCAMLRAWWRPLATSWCGLVLPVAAVLIVALREHPFWALLLLWWLRPLFGRVPLQVLGRALFGRSTGFLETAAAMPGALRTGLASSLFAQRLSPARSYLLPVIQLEGLRGPARRERCARIARRDMGSALGLCVAAAHFHASILIGLVLLLALFVPDEAAFGVSDLFAPLFDDHSTSALRMLLPALYLAGASVVEPLLVASGFALYLNRRVYLEGWDVDLAFRRLAARAGATRPRALAACLAALLLAQGAAHAQPAPRCRPDAPESAGSCAAEVLESEDFGRLETLTWWKLRDGLGDWSLDADAPELGWLTGLAELLASLGEALLWVGVVAALLAVGVSLARRRPLRSPPPETPRAGPLALFGLDLDPHSLPADPIAAAREKWRQGLHGEALSLLYRGALVALAQRAGLEIPESATELECLRLVERSQPAESAREFARLTDAWLHARYANAAPADAVFEARCAAFERAFRGAA